MVWLVHRVGVSTPFYDKPRSLIAGARLAGPKTQQFAEQFVSSLLAAECEDITVVKGERAMCYLKDVLNFRSGLPENIILRADTKPFWEECIKLTDSLHRVCAVGSPGIGKSMTTPVLIRLLLQEGKTVVFLKRTDSRGSWYHQFVPQSDGSVATTLFPEEMKPEDIPSLLDPKTYYIVDPDMTKDSCNPSSIVKANVIINASPDSRHWGGNEFSKTRDGQLGGLFCYYPLWSLAEVLAAAKYVPLNLSDSKITALYHKYGGAVRLMAEDTGVLQAQERNQMEGMNKLTSEQAVDICCGRLAAIDFMGASQPTSMVMGYQSKYPYHTGTPVIMSAHVQEAIWYKYLHVLWKNVLNATNQDSVGHFFEDLVATANIRSNDKEVPTRPALSLEEAKKADTREATLTKKSLQSFLEPLPGCESVAFVDDIVQAVRDSEKERVLYRPISPTNELIDYIYKADKVYYAVQVTIGKNPHSSPKEMIERLTCNLNLKVGEQLKLLYIVPLDRFQSFKTEPVSPSTTRCKVSIVGFANPAMEREVVKVGKTRALLGFV